MRTSMNVNLKEFEKSLWVKKEHMPRLRTFQVDGVDKGNSAHLDDLFSLMAELPWPLKCPFSRTPGCSLENGC